MFREYPNSASISTLLKELQKDSDEQPLSGHSSNEEAALDPLEQGEPLHRIMPRRLADEFEPHTMS